MNGMFKATLNDIGEIVNLYDSLNDFLAKGKNYPGWKKGLYPTLETATQGLQENNLFIFKQNRIIAGTIVLSQQPETAYSLAKWGVECTNQEAIVIRTLAVHPELIRQGIGKILMDFAQSYAVEYKMKTIRLDVSIHNTPAIMLYEKSGYQYVDTVDLGLGIPDLIWFKLYELVL